ncbi:MAG: DUF3488 domain-containing protein [Gammaproteobacteria bacterium]|nr:DUF3488 domain-containing protein [Gammaproteobacteria bacterium]
MLIVMLCLKVLEMKMKRDAMVVIFLGFFLALTNFLYSQTIAMGAYMFGCVWIFIATLIGFNRIHSEPTVRERLVPSMWLMVQAIPMMLVLFFLFPRLSGPLWSMPQEDSARTGFIGLKCSRVIYLNYRNLTRSPFGSNLKARCRRVLIFIGAGQYSVRRPGAAGNGRCTTG